MNRHERRRQKAIGFGVQELPIPAEMTGTEILRVITNEGSLFVLVAPQAYTPPEWGLALHDLAKHICNGAVRGGLIAAERRDEMLAQIVEFFNKEDREPTDVARPVGEGVRKLNEDEPS